MTFPLIAEAVPTDIDTAASPNVVNLPENISEGDLLLVIGSVDGAFMDIATPDDWELLDVDGVDSLLCVFARIADGTEGATLSVTPSDTQEAKWLALRITGAHGSTLPEIVSISVDSGSATNQPDPPALALSGWGVEDTLWLAVVGWDNGSQNRNLPAGPANYTVVNTQDWGVVCLSVFQRELAADSEDPGVFTLSGVEEWAAMTLAIRPSGSPPAGPTPRSVSVAAEVSSGNLTLAAPPSSQEGDIEVAIISARGSAPFTPPEGWEQIVQSTDGNTSTTSSTSIASGAMFWTRRGQTEPNYTFSRTGGDVARGVVAAIQNARESGSPIDGTPIINTLADNAATVSNDGITTLTADSLVLLAMAGADNTAVSGYSASTDPTSGWTEGHDSNTSTGSDTTVAFATAPKATPGATGALQMTAGVASRHVAMSVAIGAAGTEAPSQDVVISSIGGGTIQNGQAFTIAGSGFLASQGGGKVIVSPTDNKDDEGAIEQTITSWSTGDIQGTGVRSGLSFRTTYYVFVVTDQGDVNANGFEIQFVPTTATMQFLQANNDHFVGNNGQPVSLSGITVHVFRASRPQSGNADQVLTNQSIVDGEASWAANAGSLDADDPCYIHAFHPDPDQDFFYAGEVVPVLS